MDNVFHIKHFLLVKIVDFFLYKVIKNLKKPP